MTTAVDATPSRDDFVLRAAAGDRVAYRALYDAHAAEVFDFAARLLRNRRRAVEVTKAAFVDVWADLDDAATSADVRVLLLRAAARRTMGELRSPASPSADTDPELLDAEVRLSATASARVSPELAEAVWSAAAALEPADYILADLWVRRRQSIAATAKVLGTRPGRVAKRGPDVLAALDETVIALMISRHGRHECERIGAAIDELPAHAPHARLREVVAAHIADGCLRCAVRRSSLVAPAEVLGALAPIPFPPASDEEMCWRSIRAELEGPRTKARRESRPKVPIRFVGAAVAAVAAVAVVVAVAAFLLGDNSSPPLPRQDPERVRSASHEVGVPSPDNRIRIEWDRLRGADGYSVTWSLDEPELPDTTVDVPGRATATTSPKLPPGEWWFALRTRNTDGEWTSTVELGPFIVAPEPVPVIESSTTTSSSSSTSTTRPVRRTTTTRRPSTTAAPPPPPTTEPEITTPSRPPRPTSTTTTQPPPPPPPSSTTVPAG